MIAFAEANKSYTALIDRDMESADTILRIPSGVERQLNGSCLGEPILLRHSSVAIAGCEHTGPKGTGRIRKSGELGTPKMTCHISAPRISTTVTLLQPALACESGFRARLVNSTRTTVETRAACRPVVESLARSVEEQFQRHRSQCRRLGP